MNQNDNEILPHTGQDVFYEKEITIAGKDMEKPIGGNANWSSHYGKQYDSFSKTKNCTTI